jgi:hypothetical protein
MLPPEKKQKKAESGMLRANSTARQPHRRLLTTGMQERAQGETGSHATLPYRRRQAERVAAEQAPREASRPAPVANPPPA